MLEEKLGKLYINLSLHQTLDQLLRERYFLYCPQSFSCCRGGLYLNVNGYYEACMMGYYDACVIGYYGIWVILACPNFIRSGDTFGG